MVDTIDVVSVLAARIADLRRQIKDADALRTRLSQELDETIAQFTAATTGQSVPRAYSSWDPAILRVFQRFPDRYLTPRDIAIELHSNDLPHIRMRLSRMVKAGKLERGGHGRYMATSPV
jgi:hypothetical protein